MRLPPPSSFAEGQRQLFGILMSVAGVCYGLAALAVTAVIVWGDWPPELARLRLVLVGGALGGAVLGSIAVTIAMAVGGPVGRFEVKASRDGAEITADANTTTTTTTKSS